jgi:hypothetical protein
MREVAAALGASDDTLKKQREPCASMPRLALSPTNPASQGVIESRMHDNNQDTLHELPIAPSGIGSGAMGAGDAGGVARSGRLAELAPMETPARRSSRPDSGDGGAQQRNFAAFVAAGKPSRRRAPPLCEDTLEHWRLANAVLNNPAHSPKKMVPGPAGAYITDTANLRWCSALAEIKQALADDIPDV